MVSKDHKLSVRRQCALLTLARSNLYYQPKGESAENLRFMGIIDKQFLETPWYGSRQMARYMKRNGHKCGRHRVRRLMRLMRLVPIYQEPNTSKKHPQHKIWPYLLRNVVSTDPTKFGVLISPIYRCGVGSCTSWRLWIGTVLRLWRGGFPTAWTPRSASMR